MALYSMLTSLVEALKKCFLTVGEESWRRQAVLIVRMRVCSVYQVLMALTLHACMHVDNPFELELRSPDQGGLSGPGV